MPIGNPIGRTNNVASRIITVEATSAQTLFTVQGGYRVNAISVYRNGVRLANDNDYTASDGSTVLLNLAANTGDTLTFHIFDDFKVADAIVSAASTQTVYGNLAVTGSIYANNFNEGVGEFVHDSNDNVYTQSLTTLTDLTTGSDNFVVGAGASEITTGSNNNFIGNDAGRCTTTGAYNNFFGANAGLANTSGTSNNFLGLNAGRANSVGSNNTFLGQDAGCCNTSGSNNVFLGAAAGRSNTTGSNNFFVGNSAGLDNTTGVYNVSIGQSAGKSTTTGCGNVFLGLQAGCLNTTGEFNNFLGANAGIGNTTGKRNNFLGVNAGRCNASGSYNNFFGGNAGLNNSTGNSNTFMGRSAGCSNTTGGCNTFIGENSGRVNTTGNSNNFLGLNAGFSNTTGANNIFVGSCAGYSNTSGDANVFLGGNAGKCNSTGKWNFAVSSFALNNNVSGCYNVAIGRRAGVGYTGSNGIFIGAEAGRCSADGGHNIHLGFYAGCCTTGCHNNFLGEQAGRNSTTGCYNNFFGRYTGCSNTTGGHNTFMGRKAGCSNTTGSCNTFIGENAGRFNQTGVLNTFIGRNAGCCATGSYNHFFGNGAGQMTTSGEKNVFIGPLAGQYNTVGCNNIFLGHCAGRANTVGSFNNFSGQAAGCNNISGCYNNFFGNQAGFANTTGSNNNFLGRIAGCSITTGSNNFIVGNIAGTSALSDTIILGTNTTERLRIDSSGRILVGLQTATRSTQLEIESDKNVVATFTHSATSLSGNSGVTIEKKQGTGNIANWDGLIINNNDNVNYEARISWLFNSIADGPKIASKRTSASAADLRFYTTASEVAQERLRIDGDGRVGIGTDNPSAFFAGSDNLVISGGNGDGGITIDAGTDSSSRIHFADGTSGDERYRGFIVYDHSVDSLLFGSGGGGNARARITGFGSFGIGTNDPDTMLNVRDLSTFTLNTNTIDYTVFLEGGDTSGQDNYGASIGFSRINGGTRTGAVIATKQTSTDADQQGISFLTHNSSNTNSNLNESLLITHDGFLGVGTDDPATQLHLSRSGSNYLSVQSQNSSMTGVLFGDNDDPDIGQLLYSNSSDSMIFLTNTSEAMRITSGGLVGIGTDSPQAGRAPLHLHTSNNTTNIHLTNDDSNVGSQNGLTLFMEGTTSAGLWYREEGDLRFATDNAEKARLDSQGRLFVGTTTSILDTSSAKLQISATGGANAVFYRADSTVSEGDDLGVLRFYSNAGSSKQEHARIVAEADAASGDGDKPGRITFFTTADAASSPTERLRIDSSGRLLTVGATDSIPTGSSTAGLQVHSTTSQNGAMLSIARFNNDSTGGKLVLGKSRSTTVSAGTIVQNNDAVGIIEFAADDGTDMSSRVAEIHAKVDGTVGVNSAPGRIEFRTTAAGDDSPTERLRITTEGDARFGLGASGSQPSSSNRGLWIRNDGHLLVSRGVNASGVVINAWGSLGEARIYGDGDLENTNNSYTGISDIRLKENISDATTQWDDIKSLRLVNFNFKEETNMSTHRQLGLIAQEVEEISPGLVKEREDHKSVNYSVVYLKAVKALQEAMARIETLEARIAALESTD